MGGMGGATDILGCCTADLDGKEEGKGERGNWLLQRKGAESGGRRTRKLEGGVIWMEPWGWEHSLSWVEAVSLES